MKTKIEIKSIFGQVLFECEKENNTIAKTVIEAIKKKADLRYADLRYADLCFADLSSANLRSADLRSANLHSADLRYADLRYANLRYADLRYADLRYADLRSVDLNYADLRYADLRSVDLSSVDLSSVDILYANLRSANPPKRYIQIDCIGSRKGITTYCFEDNIIWCGCFKGDLEEFEAKVRETHANNEQYLKEYLGFINYLKSLK